MLYLGKVFEVDVLYQGIHIFKALNKHIYTAIQTSLPIMHWPTVLGILVFLHL
jgi:hypothetical protein